MAGSYVILKFILNIVKIKYSVPSKKGGRAKYINMTPCSELQGEEQRRPQ